MSTDFTENVARGNRACKFGAAPLTRILARSNLQALIRAHEVQQNGYQWHMLNDDLQPQCITVFSAPNYCGFYGNKGAVFFSKPRQEAADNASP